jgi:hypothetical protein
MVIIDCSWCDGQVVLDAEADSVRCDACCVTLDLAVEPASATLLAAAA